MAIYGGYEDPNTFQPMIRSLNPGIIDKNYQLAASSILNLIGVEGETIDIEDFVDRLNKAYIDKACNFTDTVGKGISGDISVYTNPLNGDNIHNVNCVSTALIIAMLAQNGIIPCQRIDILHQIPTQNEPLHLYCLLQHEDKTSLVDFIIKEGNLHLRLREFDINKAQNLVPINGSALVRATIFEVVNHLSN